MSTDASTATKPRPVQSGAAAQHLGADPQPDDRAVARFINRYGHPMLLSRRAAQRAYCDLVRARS